MAQINKRSISVCIVLSFVTLGMYSIYWEYLLVKNTRVIKKDNSSCTSEMLCLIFVPFYSLYWWFTRGKSVRDEFSKHGYSASSNETAFLILALFGLGIVAMAIMQNDFNSLPSESTQSIRRGAKKLHIPGEAIYLIATVILALAVSMLTAADFGISMIVAPAYILSQKLTFLTFGQSEYVLQGIMIILFCIVMKKVKLVYFTSFATCLIYGAILDLWRSVIPLFNPDVTAPGSMSLPIRITLFIFGVFLTSFSVALYFHTYLYPQVYDFFVKGVSKRYNLTLSKFKTCFDFSFLALACVMTLIFFKKFVGVGVGTIIMTVINGTVIGAFNKFFEKHLDTTPVAKKFSQYFNL